MIILGPVIGGYSIHFYFLTQRRYILQREGGLKITFTQTDPAGIKTLLRTGRISENPGNHLFAAVESSREFFINRLCRLNTVCRAPFISSHNPCRIVVDFKTGLIVSGIGGGGHGMEHYRFTVSRAFSKHCSKISSVGGSPLSDLLAVVAAVEPAVLPLVLTARSYHDFIPVDTIYINRFTVQKSLLSLKIAGISNTADPDRQCATCIKQKFFPATASDICGKIIIPFHIGQEYSGYSLGMIHLYIQMIMKCIAPVAALTVLCTNPQLKTVFILTGADIEKIGSLPVTGTALHQAYHRFSRKRMFYCAFRGSIHQTVADHRSGKMGGAGRAPVGNLSGAVAQHIESLLPVNTAVDLLCTL